MPPSANASTLFGLIDSCELFASSNNGVTWTIRSTLPVRDAVALQAGLSATELFLGSRSGVVYRSTDAGTSWAAVGATTASDVADLLIIPDGTLFLLTATGTLYRSTDLGASFTALATLTGSGFASLTMTIPAVKLYALSRTGEVYESLDQGVSWSAKGVFTAPDAVRLRAIASTLYALTDAGDVYRSNDAAASWTAIGTLSQIGTRGLTRNANALAAATREGHVATSPDGAAWTWQGSMNQLTLTAIASDDPATTGVGPAPPSGAGMRLAAPWPNPARAGEPIHLSLTLAEGSVVTVELIDLAGRTVWAHGAEIIPAGIARMALNPEVEAAGIYWIRVTADGLGSARARVAVMR